MNRLGLITCALSLCVVGIAHANQVEVPPPPPPPPATTSTAPNEVPPPTPVPVIQPAPSEVPPPPPPATAQVGASAHWQSSAPPSGPLVRDAGFRTHDGFFLRCALGFGGGYWSEDIGDSSSSAFSGDFVMTGLSVGLDLAVGVTVADNLALHVSMFGTGISDPEVTVDGESLGRADNTNLTGAGFGVGLTYYLMPINLYLSGAIGLGAAVLTLDSGTSDERKVDTDTGFAMSVMVGKEWWVSSQWGLGVAAQIVHVDVPDLDTRLSGTGVQVMFSATYN